jgi:hypothetical protein
MLGEIFFSLFFFWHKRNINDNFEYQVQYQRDKINKPKVKLFTDQDLVVGWTSDYVAADVAIGDDMVMLLTCRPVA